MPITRRIASIFALLSGFLILPAQAQQVVINTDDAGPGSLRQAITDVAGGGTITFNIPGDGPHTITLSSGSDIGFGPSGLVVDKEVTIDGSNEPNGVIITQNVSQRLFAVTAPGNLWISERGLH